MRDRTLFILFVVIALVLLFGSAEQRLKKAQVIGKTLYSPLMSSLRTIQNLSTIQQNNHKLRHDLATKTIELQQLHNRYDKARALSMEGSGIGYEFTIGEIVSYQGSFEDRYFVVNQGENQGVEVDFPVISNEGIVGKVISVSPNYCVVLPLTHEKFKLAVMLQRNHLQGLLESDIKGVTAVNLIRLGSDVKVGDEVVSSTLSTVFPKNFPVGKVSKLRESADKLHISAEITSYINPAMLDQVIILHYHKDTDYETTR